MSPAIGNALTAVGLRKRRRRRWPWIAGAVTVVVGAAGAAGVIAWRRNADSSENRYKDESKTETVDDYDVSRLTERTPQMAGAVAD